MSSSTLFEKRGHLTGRVAVVGDVMLDRYELGSVKRISPEAPVPVVEWEGRRFAPGGAANVALNVAALGGSCDLLGVVGQDREGEQLRSLLTQQGVKTESLVAVNTRPTSLKVRVIAHNQQMLRIDRECRKALSKEESERLCAHLATHLDQYDVVVISDYGKGVVGGDLVQRCIHAVRAAGKPVLVDPKGSDYARYRGATLLTPNWQEAGQAAGLEIVDDMSLTAAARCLFETAACEHLLITRGAHGMALFLHPESCEAIPALVRNVYDVTGAGDTTVACLALALAGGFPLLEAARLANVAAGIVVSKLGTSTVSAEELLAQVSIDGRRGW